MEYDKSAPGGMRLTPEQIIKRQAAAQTKKDEFQQLYQDAYEFALPQRQLYGVWEGGAVGSKKMQRVFDSTAINSTQRFANRLQSVVFPPQRKWATLEPGSDIPFEKQQMARNIFETYCDKMFTVLKQSNFDIAMGEFLLDLSVGTACMMVQPGDSINPINFIPVPLFLVSYEEGANGQVDNVYRKIRMKGESIIRQWPDAKIPPEMQRRIDQKPTDDIEMLEATIYDHGRGDYCYHVIDKVSKSELVYRRRKSSPWVISRYMKVAGEIYGRGPLMTALPDIKTLNKTIELLLKNASMAVSGVYTAADDGVLNPNTVKLVPGAIIPVARNGGPQGPALQPLPRSGDFNVSQLVINDLRSNIKRILLDESLPPENMSARSATEIVERMKELAQNLGSAFGRLINETMIPLTAKILEVMDERGLIDMPLRVNGLEVKVVPVAPLAQAQNQEEIGAILNYAQLMQNLGPDGQIALKMDALVDYLGDKMGVPMSVRNNRAERAIMMEEAKTQQQMAAMAQVQMMQQQQQQGQPAQQVLPAPEGI